MILVYLAQVSSDLCPARATAVTPTPAQAGRASTQDVTAARQLSGRPRLACVPLVLGLARLLAPRVAYVPALRRLVDDLTGQSLREALDALAAAAAFEQEPRAER
ncbi:MAG: hypothetical protein OHK0015_21360 [Chloroflexi bacterium OHK40]